MSKTAMVVTHYDQVRYLDLMLRSIRLSNFNGPVIVSCAKPLGSTLLSDDFKSEHEKAVGAIFVDPASDRVTKHGETAHTGILKAIEMGASMIVQSNDDVFVPEEWLRVLGNEWESLERKHGKIGMLGASTNFISGPQCRITGEFGSSEVRPTKVIRPFFAMHSADAYIECGGYPLDNPSNWFSDDVLCLMMHRAGYKSFVSRLFVYHIGSQTMKGMDLSQERSQGEFWMSRKFPGWKNELYAPDRPQESA